MEVEGREVAGPCAVVPPKGSPGYHKAYYRAHKARMDAATRKSYLKRVYGLGLLELERLSDKQGHKCAICSRELEKRRWSTHIDHNHDTGEVRGLLCQRCNAGLGMFGDSPELTEKATAYLRRRSDG